MAAVLGHPPHHQHALLTVLTDPIAAPPAALPYLVCCCCCRCCCRLMFFEQAREQAEREFRANSKDAMVGAAVWHGTALSTEEVQFSPIT